MPYLIPRPHMNQISLNNVFHRYPGGKEVLHNINLTIDAGERICLIGSSGAGKSTLLRLMAALEQPYSGTVIVAGHNTSTMSTSELPYLRRQCGLILDDVKLLPNHSVMAHVLLPLDIAGIDRQSAQAQALSVLETVGLNQYTEHSPMSLSGGDQQRLRIARAIVHQPILLFADEPTTNLDADDAEAIGALFRKINLSGTTVILASHDRQLMTQFKPRLIELNHGKLRA